MKNWQQFVHDRLCTYKTKILLSPTGIFKSELVLVIPIVWDLTDAGDVEARDCVNLRRVVGYRQYFYHTIPACLILPTYCLLSELN